MIEVPYQCQLVKNITTILNTPVTTSRGALFKFENSTKVASFNSKLLRSMNNDFHKAIKAQRGSFLDIGSEFRPVSTIEPIFVNHPRWKKLRRIIQEGAIYSFKKEIEYPEHIRQSDLSAALARGNNKSATIAENKTALIKSYTDEVRKGWMIPFYEMT